MEQVFKSLMRVFQISVIHRTPEVCQNFGITLGEM
jgi:hypothetical protein